MIQNHLNMWELILQQIIQFIHQNHLLSTLKSNTITQYFKFMDLTITMLNHNKRLSQMRSSLISYLIMNMEHQQANTHKVRSSVLLKPSWYCMIITEEKSSTRYN